MPNNSDIPNDSDIPNNSDIPSVESINLYNPMVDLKTIDSKV